MQTYSALFWLNKARIRNDEAPIFLRITINGKRAEISLKRSIEPAQWNSKTSRAKGNSEQVRSLNNFLDSTKGKLFELHQSLVLSGKSISAEDLKNKFMGVSEPQKMLLEVFKIHNDAMKKKLSIEFAKNTLIHYTTVYGKVRNFLKYKFKKTDIALGDLDFKFMADFDYYLKTVENISHNSSMNYMKNLKKIVNMAVLNGWLEKSPFTTFKISMKETQRGFLSQEELDILIKKEFEDKILEEIRDVFIFSCYTGYAFIDIKNLSPENIHQDSDGEKWIITNRQKTASISNVPLLPIAQKLVEKYQNHPKAVNKNRLFPMKQNYLMNLYLKDIARACGIKSHLTCHKARHTFATTVTLSNGVPIETVSAMLGHKSLATTKIYAKVLNSKVGNDMKQLKEKLFGPKSN